MRTNSRTLWLTSVAPRARAWQPIQRLWIDHAYGEEELTFLEEELLPALDHFLACIGEIDAAREATADAKAQPQAAA